MSGSYPHSDLYLILFSNELNTVNMVPPLAVPTIESYIFTEAKSSSFSFNLLFNNSTLKSQGIQS